MFEGLERIETPDETTVFVRFAQPFAPFLSYATTYGTLILPREIYDQDGSFQKHIAGSGPMQVDPGAMQHGSRWIFRRNPAYWADGRPYVDGVTYVVTKDPSTQYAAFQTRQIDVIRAVVDESVKAALAPILPRCTSRLWTPGRRDCT